MKYELPKLSYSYDALEPSIDAATMQIHHTKHHQAYIDKLNGVLEKYPEHLERPLEELMKIWEHLPMEEADKTALRNNGGGHLNHALFWQIMGPEKQIDEKLVSDIGTTFGSVDEFKKTFSQAAVGHFGSGWAWLARNHLDRLEVYSLPNQDSPYLKGHTPLIGLDVWEHAYYLKYQNRRAEYAENWWKVLKLL